MNPCFGILVHVNLLVLVQLALMSGLCCHLSVFGPEIKTEIPYLFVKNVFYFIIIYFLYSSIQILPFPSTLSHNQDLT